MRADYVIDHETRDELESYLHDEWRLARQFAEDESGRSGTPPIPEQSLLNLAKTIAGRLSEHDSYLLQAIVQLTEANGSYPVHKAIADRAGVDVQPTRERVGAMFRFGLLDRGPSGKGSVLTPLGRLVVTEVTTKVHAD